MPVPGYTSSLFSPTGSAVHIEGRPSHRFIHSKYPSWARGEANGIEKPSLTAVCRGVSPGGN